MQSCAVTYSWGMAHQVPALTTFLLPAYSHGMAHQVPTFTTFLLPAYSWGMAHEVPTLTTFLLPGYSWEIAHQVPTLTTFLLPGYSWEMAHQVPTLTTFLLPHHRQHHWFLGLPLTSLSPSTRLPPPTYWQAQRARPPTHTLSCLGQGCADLSSASLQWRQLSVPVHCRLYTECHCTVPPVGLPGPSCPLQDQQCLAGHLSRSELGFYPVLLLHLQCLDSHTTLLPLGVVTTIVFTILLRFHFHYPAPIQLKHYAWFVFQLQLRATFFHINVQTLTTHRHIYDLVPKGVQEKRTEVLENKVDRIWVSNAFF